ncbi:unnamed protein product [Ilex paraguariensis]|uniref:Uncharacterized protein n=1 Tax=Ilex paraguariensis TaxID=185542 RepID=A0ABC8UUR4_9AQUA
MEFLSSHEELFSDFKLPLLTLILATIVGLLVRYCKSMASSFRSKKLPPGSLGYPFIGETLSFLRSQKEDKIIEWMANRITMYGPVFKTSLMGSKTVVITGQAGNRFMFSGADNGIASNQPVPVAKIIGKHSIFEVSGSRHKLVRGAMMNFLKAESLQRHVGQMNSLVEQQLFQELNGKDSIQVVELMQRMTFKVTCSLLFKLAEGKEKDSLFKDFTLALRGAWAIPLDFPGTIFRKAVLARGRITKVLSDLIRMRKKDLENGKKGSQEDVISTFLVLRDENGKPLPEEEIIDNLVTLIIASHDTNSILLTLLVRHLARDVDVCNKVLEEQMQVLKAREGSAGALGWSDVQMMKYTWRVAQELMRLISPAFGNFRQTSRDTFFGGFDIPKGWQVFWRLLQHTWTTTFLNSQKSLIHQDLRTLQKLSLHIPTFLLEPVHVSALGQNLPGLKCC